MSSRATFITRLALTLGACGLLLAVLVWQHERSRERWSIFLSGDPGRGVRIFEKKGCADCHAVNGWGGRRASDLGFRRPHGSDMSELITAMWNHAPQMWEMMHKERVIYPSIQRREMADLIAFLYVSRYVDEPGNVDRGRELFHSKRCADCHATGVESGKIGPALSTMGGLGTPIVWAEAMWNHAPAMEKSMQELGMKWPSFDEREMNDLLAFITARASGLRRESELFPADPDRGRAVFEAKACAACHSLDGNIKAQGPDLAGRQQRPLTPVQFAGAMWNHSPAMWVAMEKASISRSQFEGTEMADLVAFLSIMRYFEPGGSPGLGQNLFSTLGCPACHGKEAQGSSQGPALRGRGRNYSLVNLASGLWVHGPKMYSRLQERGQPWPKLRERDVGDLLAYLNSSSTEGQ